MTDTVLSTEIANTPEPGYYLPGKADRQPPVPNVVPPYSGSNTNVETVMALASRGAFNLNLSLNNGGQTGPASVLAAMSTGATYAGQDKAGSMGYNTAPKNPNIGNPGAVTNNGGVVGSNVP